MRVITCAGYYRTGSSAVTDLFSEFEGCKSLTSYEFRFIQDPNGIRDLEYNLIENNHRHNTSNAIKNYYKFAKMLNGSLFRKGYKRYMGKTFMKETNKYIDNITELKTDTWWHYDRYQKGKFFNFIDVSLNKIAHKLKLKGCTSLLKLSHEKGYYSAIDKKTFYTHTKNYIMNCLSSAMKEPSDFIMVDQLVPPSNISSYLNYFDDVKVIVVERDPRDLYLLEKTKYRWGVMPYKNVEDFCKWYEITRRRPKEQEIDQDKVMLINFEDLIYKYEETSKKLIDFVGLTNHKHVCPKKFLDPSRSIKGTNLKKKFPQYQKDVEYIEEHLKEFLYNFED